MKPTVKVFKCPQCDKTYKTPSGLSRHKGTHTSDGKASYCCSICSTFKTDRKDNYDRHLNSCLKKQEKKDPDWSCPGCQKSFGAKQAMDRHIAAAVCTKMEKVKYKKPLPRKSSKKKQDSLDDVFNTEDHILTIIAGCDAISDWVDNAKVQETIENLNKTPVKQKNLFITGNNQNQIGMSVEVDFSIILDEDTADGERGVVRKLLICSTFTLRR